MQVSVANLHYCALQVTEKQIYNLLKPNKRLLYLEKRRIRPYPATGSHQQMSLRKKEDSDAENAP